MCDVSRGARGSLRVQGNRLSTLPSMVTALVHAFDVLVLHGCWGERNPVCECHTRPVSSFRRAELQNETAGEKKSLTEGETAGSRPVSQRCFISPVVKFISRLQILNLLLCQGEQHKVTPPGSRLHACLSSSALLNKKLMMAAIIDEYDHSFLILTLYFNYLLFHLNASELFI